MAIYDIIEEVSKKQVEKTDTGDSRVMGVMLGKVVKNYDENLPGRVSVILLSREQGTGKGAEADNTRLLWARVVMSSSGKNWGHYFIPEVGDLVLVAFEGGNIERAYVVGCIPSTKDKILTGSKDPKNKYKKIVTKNGNSIIFEDVSSEGNQGDQGKPGEKDKITIKTATEMFRIAMNNEKKLLEISDKTGKNFIRFQTAEEKGHLEVKAAKKLTLKVGDNISVIMNGDTGAVTVKAKKITMQADASLIAESNGRANIKGANVALEGSGSMKVSSGGLVEVAGTPVKLG